MDRDVKFFILLFVVVTVPHLILEDGITAMIISCVGLFYIFNNYLKKFKDGEEV